MANSLIIGGVVATGTPTTLDAYLQAGGVDAPGDWGYLALRQLGGQDAHGGILRYRLDAVQGEVVTPLAPQGRATSHRGGR